jgi:hypothetical protein
MTAETALATAALLCLIASATLILLAFLIHYGRSLYRGLKGDHE